MAVAEVRVGASGSRPPDAPAGTGLLGVVAEVLGVAVAPESLLDPELEVPRGDVDVEEEADAAWEVTVVLELDVVVFWGVEEVLEEVGCCALAAK